MEMVWACFMQMTNLVHVTAYLEYSNSLTLGTRIKTNSSANAHCELGGKFSWEVVCINTSNLQWLVSSCVSFTDLHKTFAISIKKLLNYGISISRCYANKM